MSETWQERVAEIGKIINRHVKTHPELQPLLSAWINFDSKNAGVFKRKRKAAGLKVITKNEFQRMQTQISRQADEIQALEYRIKTLLER